MKLPLLPVYPVVGARRRSLAESAESVVLWQGIKKFFSEEMTMITLRTNWTFSTPVPATGGYKVWRKIDGGAANLVASVGSNINQYDDVLSVPVGTHSFEYGVSGLNTTGAESDVGWGAPVNATINEPTPSVPGGVSTTQV